MKNYRMENELKPLISYYGGKQRIASKIIKYIPKHTVYVEPFFGGGAVMFAKPYPKITNGDHYREIINDKDELLINLYRVCQDRTKFDELKYRLGYTPCAQSEHTRAKEILKNKIGSDIDLAWAYFVSIFMSFSNTISGGFSYTTFGKDFAKVWQNKIQIEPFFDRLRHVTIFNEDAISVIKRVDSPHTFFYCDPPYPGANQGHYSGYTVEDFNSLCETLNSCKGSFIFSNYNQEMKYNWKRVEIEAVASSAKTARYATKKSRTEIIWMRGNTQPVRPEIQKLYDSGIFDCYGI